MQSVLHNFKIQINSGLYLKDPETSDLGRRIIQEGILLIDEVGFENFTFKKLGKRIKSNESSIYRYFENKNRLMLYLSSWYWSWIEYKIAFSTANISDSFEQLKKAVVIISEKVENDAAFQHISETILNKIVFAEFTKTLYTKEIETENKEGFFTIYKRIINRIVVMMNEAFPNYPYSKSLASSIIEGAMHQHFLKENLHSITDCNHQVSPADFYLNMLDLLYKNYQKS